MRGKNVSNTDSFIEEVNEEVQRDRMYHYMRRYGWIAALAVVALVGGAAYNEYRKASIRSAAENLGDATMAALSADSSDAQVQALGSIKASGPSGEVIALLQSAAAASDDKPAAIAALRAIRDNAGAEDLYKDLARLKLVMLQGADASASDRIAVLDALAVPGQPFRLLALEQKAVILVETGDTVGALEILQDLLSEQSVSGDLRQRATQLIVALGAEPKA